MDNQVVGRTSEIPTSSSGTVNPSPVFPKAKTSILVPILFSTVVSAAVFGFGGYYLGVSQKSTLESLKTVVINTEQPIQATPTPSPSVQVTMTPALSPTATSTQAQKYDSKFLSFDYPSRLFVWSYGRGVSLGYFQLNSVDQKDQNNRDKVVITFDVQTLGYTESKSITEQKAHVEGLQKEYPDSNYVISSRMVDGVTALVYESTFSNSPSYEKVVWLIKDNVKYIISMNALGTTPESRDILKNMYAPDFDSILNTVKLKYVDPKEVERIGAGAS